ncbi:MAG: 50S ribosomal protein L11 [Flavobacteriales bacterium]|nr:MAG: 50S ribosomal protein L11 [Flavobacteriales bacterium]
MSKKIKALIKLALPAGKANPAPPVGPALGQHGINIAQFCKEYNARTQNQQGLIIPAKITIYEDKTFSFILKSPPVSNLLLKVLNIKKGSTNSNKDIIGFVTEEQLKEIAEIKITDLNTKNINKAISIVMGTAKNMGIQIQKQND